ncbi:hypothetical protein QBC32DRAFT_397062 [Pseudoneurospora amorphoporcata]|uniref:Uncharacterized protein n=1 Tax=Pseudoneurospora amorphoporcata TaxID=241081 RepID=A0AAN6SH64_9PEZI|nr:hypothetical protein QBC32DRAFT_397062 [Pseudoneurospora amorphoporcata]
MELSFGGMWQPPNVSSSWRMVEGGENDSFDTSLMPDDYDGNDMILSSQSDHSHVDGSQPFSMDGSQPFSIGGSQDESLEGFLHRAEDDDQVIMRTPFRPSIPQSVRHASRENMRHRIQPTPQEFYMPMVDVDSKLMDSRRSSTRSSITIRQFPPSLPGLRHRQTHRSDRHRLTESRDDHHSSGEDTEVNADIEERVEEMKRSRTPKRQQAPEIKGFFDRFFDSVPDAVFNTFSWALGVVGLAFRYAQKPIAILVSVYLIFGLLSMVQNMATLSIHAALSPVCRVPGARWLNLPFCVDSSTKTNTHIQFDPIIEVQDRFEGVLEKAAESASLPLEMKRSELAIRDLRTMVRYSQLHGKEQLILEFDGYIDAASSATWDLQRFNTRVGSTIDSIISVNRWTSRYIDELSDDMEHRGIIGEWWDWVFSPFQPSTYTERKLLDQYIDHTIRVSDKIANLIREAQAVLVTLQRAEDHLEVIYDFVTRTQEHIQAKKEEVFWQLWTYIGIKSGNRKSYNNQLTLLGKVEEQRSEAVTQLSELIVELQNIQASLNGLRDRVGEPEVARDAGLDIPLYVHVETIDRGVERLESARNKIRDVENERVREALARGKEELPELEAKAYNRRVPGLGW